MLNLLRQSVVTIDGAFTLEYFQKFFGKSYYLITLWNSFKVSIAVTIITLIIGVPLAYACSASPSFPETVSMASIT